MPVELAQYQLRTASFELRYTPSLLIWDVSGSLWNEVAKKYPTLQVEQASPTEIKIAIDDKSSAAVLLDRAHCLVQEPKGDADELKRLSSVLFPTLFKLAKIENLSRIGFRLIFSKNFETRLEAAQFFGNQASTKTLKGKHLNVDGEILEPEIRYRYEGEALGFLVSLKAQHATLNLPLPAEFSDLAPKKTERDYVTLDIDYYAHGTTPVAAFDASALIASWLHLVRRDIGKIL